MARLPASALDAPGDPPVIDGALAVRHLRRVDPRLGEVIDRVGPCPLVPTRHTPFQALLRSIVYQQLSGKAAATILGRVVALFPGKAWPSPGDVLAAPDEALRGAGLSRNKLLAIRDLAEKTLDGTVPTRRQMLKLGDEAIIDRCTAVRGIGRWTVEMLLIFHLCRPDLLPLDDLGIRKGAARLYRMRQLPKPERLLKTGEPWRPWRSVASWYLWRVLELPEGSLPGER